MKSRIMIWAGNVASMGEGEVHTGFWWGDLMEGNHLDVLRIDTKIIIKLIVKKWDGGHGLD
jgi:hypothetical protein